MYKVFVNDKPIILTDSLKKENNFRVYLFKDLVIDEILHKLKRSNTKGVNLFCADLKDDWNTFLKHFKVVAAAGGLVLNPNKDILFIHRLGIWDLPKGRIEEGETISEAAVREVEEECGVNGLVIDMPLITTYHLFYMDATLQLKITHWFLMKTNYQGQLTPQLEEGITKVEFKNEVQVAEAIENTYANIKLVLDTYRQV
ncbi:MAG: NUDIX domain-containing protein [Polaribacter sp.]|nr:NUDIX domain-containing protein [Polaribacter sp.]